MTTSALRKARRCVSSQDSRHPDELIADLDRRIAVLEAEIAAVLKDSDNR